MRTLLNKLREFKGANIVLFVVFATTIYLQCCFFHESLDLPWNPKLVYFKIFKISIAILIASFIFFFKHKSWIIYISTFINLWGISNIMYRRANQILIDAYSVTMVNNMDGFWSSVPFYMDVNDFTIFYTTLIVTLTYILFRNKRRSISSGIIAIILSIGIHIYSYERRVRFFPAYKPFIEKKLYNPFKLDHSTFACWDLYDKSLYTRDTSILHHFLYQTNYFIQKILFVSPYKLSEQEEKKVNQFINKNQSKHTPKIPVYIILVESFESWALTPDVMPNLYNFINENNVLWVQKITSQTRGGTSADGQMIINTGLLPTKEGAACFRFPNNTFPAISKLYDKTFNIIPGGQTVWNQVHMNVAYRIKDNIDGTANDKELVGQFMDLYKKYDYGMLLTMSTHSPFNRFSNQSKLSLPEDMPKYMSDYLKSFNYTDESFKPILDAIKNDEHLKNSVIVITGDHTIFPKQKRDEFNKYCQDKSQNYSVNDGYCPLIIYSPNFKEQTTISDIKYQMDIFPTVLSAIGCKDYYWNGFGVDLLDSTNISNRKISATEALELSDKLHQANYFRYIDAE